MSDVAVLAGVSHQTVSRVLNNHPSVRAETRDRVLAAIVELGYRRNTAARALVTRRSGTIGIVTTNSRHFGPTSALIEVVGAAREHGYFVSVVTLTTFDQVSVSRAIEHLLSQAAEGVIVIAPEAEVRDALEPYADEVPLVTIASGFAEGLGFHTMSVDQDLGARLATGHLLGLGHRTVTHVAGPEDSLDARARVAGWQSELQEAGAVPGDLIQGDWSADQGYEIGRVLAREGAPTAVFAANDLLAIGLLRAFFEAGISVPGDVSVVGFDDIMGAAYLIPPLTTVRQDFTGLGRRCLEMLLLAMAGQPLDHTPVVPHLIVRESTAAPRN
jgi:DNA-binding LacI/PurR family transcriptional regulator